MVVTYWKAAVFIIFFAVLMFDFCDCSPSILQPEVLWITTVACLRLEVHRASSNTFSLFIASAARTSTSLIYRLTWLTKAKGLSTVNRSDLTKEGAEFCREAPAVPTQKALYSMVPDAENAASEDHCAVTGSWKKNRDGCPWLGMDFALQYHVALTDLIGGCII